MRTVAEVLIEERAKLGYSLDEVQRKTKIRKSIIEALEKGDYDSLPPPTFVKGFIRNYGQFLGLDVEELLALFRREYDERKNPKTSGAGLDKRRFLITPGIAIAFFLALMVLLFFGYLYREYQSFAAPPFLSVEEPQDSLKLNKPLVSLVGRTDPDAEVKINGQKITLGPGGTFAQEISISEGTNVLVTTATNKLGKISTVKRTVIVEVPKPTPPPSPPTATASATPSAKLER